ncbi:hypothetical protein NDU88_001890 [Pleurodeles waltl]|uniref:Uncharacterized protein n=1 Tax=Pleurodeles waltl TaxID=8319 RepID=A0AAV7LE61_PLEWA|nr:hypothetical protein NDU88_001890 [Pleurodeles waltl]
MVAGVQDTPVLAERHLQEMEGQEAEQGFQQNRQNFPQEDGSYMLSSIENAVGGGLSPLFQTNRNNAKSARIDCAFRQKDNLPEDPRALASLWNQTESSMEYWLVVSVPTLIQKNRGCGCWSRSRVPRWSHRLRWQWFPTARPLYSRSS